MKGPESGWREKPHDEKIITRLGRKALAVGAFAEVLGHKVQAEFAEHQEVHRRAFSGSYHALGYAVRTLDAKWEEYRFEQLQQKKNAKLVKSRRGKVAQTQTTAMRADELLQDEFSTWTGAAKMQIDAVNIQLKELGMNIPSGWKTMPELQEHLDDVLNLLDSELAHHKETERSPGAKPHIPTNHERLVEAVVMTARARDGLSKLWERVESKGRTSSKRTKKAKNTSSEAGTPEARIQKREDLLDDREGMLFAIRTSQVNRLRIGRKLMEKREDMKELWAGRNPVPAREQRELEGIHSLIKELRILANEAQSFEDTDALREKIGRTKRAYAIGRRPIAFQLERLITTTELPEEIRRLLERILPERHAPLAPAYAQRIANRLEAFLSPPQLVKEAA